MEKDHNNYHLVQTHTHAPAFPASFNGVDYSHPHQVMKFGMGEACGESSNANGMVDYMLNPQEQEQEQEGCGYYGTRTISSCCSFDKLSFADVMQLADLGPKLGLNQSKIEEDQEAAGGMDPVLFLKFPVLNDKSLGEDHDDHSNNLMLTAAAATGGREDGGEEAVGASHKSNNNKIKSVQLGMVGGEEEDMEISKGVQDDENNNNNINNNNNMNNKSKRKRSRTIKTSEEVESQRMTHIAVERNRRKQMNEHLRVLRSLMPGSYVQRGDQASIIGGAIEFVRELEQLLQCLESQKRRRLLGVGEAAAHTRQVVGDASLLAIQAQAQAQQHQQQQPPMFLALPNHEEFEAAAAAAGLREETAENKSCLADVEVKLLGFDAMIKILSRRRPGQLIKTIAALEDLHLIILHTNITTIEQTVLYSFNVKVASDSRFTAQDIATSVQQIFSFIHDNTGM